MSRDAPRPASLYVPLIPVPDDPSADAPLQEPTWPFDRRASTQQVKLMIPGTATPGPPKSPTGINSLYADPSPDQQTLSLGSAAANGQRRGASSPSEQYSEKQSYGNAKGDSSARRDSSYDIPSPSSSSHTRLPLPYNTPANRFDTPKYWLILYFGFNLGLTLYNKLVLQGFPFPWTLTGIQMLSGTIGTQIALRKGYFVQAKLDTKENLVMLAFSCLYTINIAVSNLSLHLVTVPFHQVVRAMTPLFTILLSVIFFSKNYSRATYLSLLPVVVGVVFATYGDYQFTTWGLILTLIGTLLAAMKTIVTNKIQVGRLKLHPLDLLIRMSPLACLQCLLWGWYSGELGRVAQYDLTRSKASALLMNGVIAFGLNVVSFTANKKTSALTMTVAANVKQVLTIILAVIIFSLSLNLTNVFGITLTLAGGAWYARIELLEKSRNSAAAASSLETTLPNGLRVAGP